MKEETSGIQRTREYAPLKFSSFDEVFKDMRDSFDSIARRAYEIFEENGRQLGRDLEDWFRAEKELLHPMHFQLTEAENEWKVKAEVPGFTEKDLEISVEPRRLTIAGKRETSKEEKNEKIVYSERCANQILRVMDLPADVDTGKAAATLKDGLLELKLPKAAESAPGKKIKVTKKG